jgi:hypothetical protein
MKLKLKHALALLALTASANLSASHVINDDLIVIGSSCIGMDCVNGESFGFDTLRLKENNLRIKFQDTSNSGSFPSVDWQITANDSVNGGLNKFSIDSIDNSAVPFTVEYGAKTNSVYIDSTSRVGFGTNNPILNLHVKEGNTPALRLEQDGTSGFTPQTWDIAGNEANFFIRDATNGSKLPFKIKPGAPTNSLYINSNGDIGLGTATPDAKLDLESGDLQLSNGNIQIKNTNDPSIILTENDDVNNTWKVGVNDSLGNGFAILNSSPDANFLGMVIQPDGDIFINNGTDKIGGLWSWHIDGLTERVEQSGDLYVGGDITAQGTISPGSSRATKNNINLINGESILKLIANLDIYSWSYIKDAGKVTHIGPMAEEFFETFNVGVDNKHISPTDTSGISLAAIKALMDKVDSQNRKIIELENTLNQLQKRQH